MGIDTYKDVNYHLHGYGHINVNASDKSSRSAKSIKSICIPPGQTINLPVSTRTSATYEPTDMMVEMTHNIKGINLLTNTCHIEE